MLCARAIVRTWAAPGGRSLYLMNTVARRGGLFAGRATVQRAL